MLTQTLSEYIVGALEMPLPDTAVEAGRLHCLDAITSIVVGSQMPVGPIAIAYVDEMAGCPESTVVGSGGRSNVVLAAMANGIMAHADETDDSHAPSLTHPGCSIVPAALAVAQKSRRSGQDLLRAIVLGYDVGTRLSMALGAGAFFDHYGHSSHAFGGTFGSCAAASVLFGLDSKQTAWALAYAVQLVSGIPCWYRDPDHMEKAFLFGGMPAQSGVQAAAMAAAGFSGSAEPLEGTPGLFTSFPDKCDPSKLTEELGQRFEVERTTIKKWSTGSPIQSALDSTLALMDEHGLTAEAVEKIDVVLPPRRAIAVDNRAMPAVNLQHQLALLLVDGDVTFVSGHDEHRFKKDEELAAIRQRIFVRADENAPEGGTAHLTVQTRNGRILKKHTRFVRGTPGNPMTREEVVAKARRIMAPVLSGDTEPLISAVLDVADFEALDKIIQCLEPNRVGAHAPIRG